MSNDCNLDCKKCGKIFRSYGAYRIHYCEGNDDN